MSGIRLPSEPYIDCSTSYRRRQITAFLHLLVGSTVVICGILAVNVHFPGEDMGTPVRDGRDDGDWLDRRDSEFWGMWMGLVIIFASIFGFLSKSSKFSISLYMASNIFTSSVATTGVIIGGLCFVRINNFLHKLLNDYYEVPKYPDYYYPCFVPSSVAGSTPVESVDDMTQQLYDECFDLHYDAAISHLLYYGIMFWCFLVEFFNALYGIRYSCVGLGRCSSSGRSAPARRNQLQAHLQHIQRHNQFYLQPVAPRPVTPLSSNPDLVTELPSHDPPPPYSSPHNHQNGGQSNHGSKLTETELPSYELAVSLFLDG